MRARRFFVDHGEFLIVLAGLAALLMVALTGSDHASCTVTIKPATTTSTVVGQLS